MPLVQRLFSFEKFSLFFGERFGNLEFFFEFKKNIYIYMNKVHQMLHGIFEFKKI